MDNILPVSGICRIFKKGFICIHDHISCSDMIRDTPNPADVDAMVMKVRTFLPDVIGDLKELISVPSVAFPGYSPSRSTGWRN